MQAVLCLREEFGEKFVIPGDEVEFARAKRPSIHPFASDRTPVRDDIEKTNVAGFQRRNASVTLCRQSCVGQLAKRFQLLFC
jgi:hypothetical protein